MRGKYSVAHIDAESNQLLIQLAKSLNKSRDRRRRHQVRIFIGQQRKETGILWKTFGSQIITSFGGKI